MNHNPVIFDSPKTAKLSQEYAQKIAKARSLAQGETVSTLMAGGFEERGLAPGNAWWVQVLSKDVPWVYNEMGARTGDNTTNTMTIDAEQAYAEGLVKGIEAAVPITGKTGAGPSENLDILRSCLVKTLQDRPAMYRPKKQT